MSEPPSVVGRRSRGAGSVSPQMGDGVRTPPGTDVRALVPTLLRGYPPVLGAMLLVEGVVTLILGGDATVSLGEVVAYLLLPPLAMFLVNQTTGGRRPNAVTFGVAGAGAVVLLVALFLGGGVHLLTVPGWSLALVGLLLLGAAVFVMRLSAPAPEENVSPLLSHSERAQFSERDEYPAAGEDDYGSARHSASPDDYGAAPGGYGDNDRPSGFDWPPARRDEAAAYGAGHAASHSAADDEHSYGGAGGEAYGSGGGEAYGGAGGQAYGGASGPSEPEWPPRRATHSAGPAEVDWSDRPAAAAEPEWGNRSAAPTENDWSQGPTNRDWPPAASAHEWPPRREGEPTEPAPDGGPRSWFEPEPEAAEPSWSAEPTGPPDREWPPANPDSAGGRRSRYPDR